MPPRPSPPVEPKCCDCSARCRSGCGGSGGSGPTKHSSQGKGGVAAAATSAPPGAGWGFGGFVVENYLAVVCNQCASCHRSLGRHISKVKRGGGLATQKLHHQLAPHVNEILEAAVPPMSKPTDSSPIADKLAFITTKYQNHAYIVADGGPGVSIQQLALAVAKGDLVATFSLLCQDADPNARALQKDGAGPTALHLAAAVGHAEMIELLLLHDADPNSVWSGQTAEAIAQARGHLEVAARLRESSQHLVHSFRDWLIAAAHGREPGFLEHARASFDRVPRSSLEHLAVDLYDELDRRALDKHWTEVASARDVENSMLAPFLPIVDALPSDRQQSRQKLATLTEHRFTCLVEDTLAEIDKRCGHWDTDGNRPSRMFCPTTSPLSPGRLTATNLENVITFSGFDLSVSNTDGRDDGPQRATSLEALVAELQAENKMLRASNDSHVFEIARLRLALAQFAGDDAVTYASIDHGGDGGGGGGYRAAADEPVDVKAEMAAYTGQATTAIKELFTAAKLGDAATIEASRVQVEAAVRAIITFVASVDGSVDHSRLTSNIDALASKQLPKEIMLQTYAVAQEINRLVESM